MFNKTPVAFDLVYVGSVILILINFWGHLRSMKFPKINTMKELKLGHVVLLCAFAFFACNKIERSFSETGTLTVEATVNPQTVEISSRLKSTPVNTSIDDYWIYLFANEELQESYPVQYADLPSEIELPVGSYRILASSAKPEYVVLPTRDSAKGLYFTGETTINIVAEETTQADVVARQAVASVAVEFTAKFTEAFSDYSASVSGVVFDEQDTAKAYYEPGNVLQVELTYTDNDEEKIRYFETGKAVAAGDDWLLSFDASGEMAVDGNGAISLSVSTVTSPQNEGWVIEIGGASDDRHDPMSEDGTSEFPYSVETARTIQDGTLAWVQGYIVGFIKSSTNVITSWSDASDTNIAIASTAGQTDIDKMLFVELSGAGSSARTALGLASTQGSSMGKKVKLNGSLEAYYSNSGLKGVNRADEYMIVE